MQDIPLNPTYGFTYIAGLAIGHAGLLPSGPMLIVCFLLTNVFIFIIFYCNDINYDTWWIGQLVMTDSGLDQLKLRRSDAISPLIKCIKNYGQI